MNTLTQQQGGEQEAGDGVADSLRATLAARDYRTDGDVKALLARIESMALEDRDCINAGRSIIAEYKARLAALRSKQPAASEGDGLPAEVYGLFRAIVDAGGPSTIARHGVEKGADKWEADVRAGLVAIERIAHPERFADEHFRNTSKQAAGEAVEPHGYLVHRRGRLLGDRYLPADAYKKYVSGGYDGSVPHSSDTVTPLYTAPPRHRADENNDNKHS